MLTRFAAVLAAVGLLAGGSAVSRGTGGAVAGSPGIGDPYFPQDGNGGIDVTTYDVHDAYRFSDGRVKGWTTVTLRTSERLSSFDLDFLLPVSSVHLSTGAATFDRPTRHELRITPHRVIPDGTTVRVRVTYAGHPGHIAWNGEQNWTADADEVVAINEPHMAPWWFPSDDHPLDKARLDLHITVPRSDQVVAGGRLVGVRRSGHHATYHWRGGGPMATYLAFFAAGRFVVRQGTSHGLRYYSAVSRQLSPGERHSALRGVRRTSAIVAWLSRQVGHYPFAETGGVVTSLDPGFSLETQTRPTYPIEVSDLLMVHELAHQWFGDSVSVHYWRDVWMNEGFATFMEHLWSQDHGGPSTRAWLHEAYRSTPSDSPFWQLPVADPGPGHLFDWPVYQRGGMALAALRERVGHPVFAHLLRAWTKRHFHGHGTTERFEALASRLSGEDLTSFFDAWVRQPTRPEHTSDNGL